ncbi:hypothetical protein KTE23_05245 [Burkholderia multivorans]|uniref:hypothetical protein n=1 Tax=Burkholderia multivorans TaxID=87883 RepID=UPI001C24733C|nr:hypothetical protein [Burkholderia multivorans]MBU9415981.1 hypothetical protein [Burkholderia multivorans]
MTPFEQQVRQDFKTYWDAAEKGKLEDRTAQRPLLVSAHKYAICFATLSRAMGSEEVHCRIFLQELASDTIHLVHALVNGDARGARFYLRSVIENFWRHHYFRDHPVEYGWLHTRSKYYLEMKTLREHCGWLDCFQGEIKPLCDDLNRLYAELSTAVHSTSSKTLVLRQALEDIRLTLDQSNAVKGDLHAVMKACLALCMFSEHQTYLGLRADVQEFLKGVLSVRERNRLLKDLEQVT